MIFTNKSTKELPPLIFSNHIIKRTNQHKLLGVTYDDHMTFKPHISNVSLKLSRTISLLYQVKDIVPDYVLKALYNAHVLPHLLYCTPIWGNTYPTHLLPLFRLQKKIIRLITNNSYFAHTHPLFKQTNILKLFDLNKLFIAKYMYKVCSSNVDILQPIHNYPTRARGNLRTPLHALSIFKHSMSYSGPVVWNSIPDHIRCLNSLNSFKKQFKKHIISQY